MLNPKTLPPGKVRMVAQAWATGAQASMIAGIIGNDCRCPDAQRVVTYALRVITPVERGSLQAQRFLARLSSGVSFYNAARDARLTTREARALLRALEANTHNPGDALEIDIARGHDFEPEPAHQPTHHPPGSKGKVAELARRFEQGQQLFHHADATRAQAFNSGYRPTEDKTTRPAHRNEQRGILCQRQD